MTSGKTPGTVFGADWKGRFGVRVWQKGAEDGFGRVFCRTAPEDDFRRDSRRGDWEGGVAGQYMKRHWAGPLRRPAWENILG
jgi:hypothetical protein